MTVTLEQEYQGQTFSLTLSAPGITADLSRFEVESRIVGVLRRELQRFAEITMVALVDQADADQRATEARARKARGEPPPVTGPAQVLAAGTKDESGRVIVTPRG